MKPSIAFFPAKRAARGSVITICYDRLLNQRERDAGHISPAPRVARFLVMLAPCLLVQSSSGPEHLQVTILFGATLL